MPPAQLPLKAYNSNMGGADLADQIHCVYTSSNRSSRRWHLRLFWLLLDLAVDNAIILANFGLTKKEQYVTVFWKTNHLRTRTEIHFLPVHNRHTHALSSNRL